MCLLFLFFKGREHGTDVVCCRMQVLKKHISLQVTDTKLLIKHRGCLWRWRPRAIFVCKAPSRSSKASVWTKWKERRKKKKLLAASLPETYSGGCQVAHLSFDWDHTRYKVIGRDWTHTHTDTNTCPHDLLTTCTHPPCHYIFLSKYLLPINRVFM